MTDAEALRLCPASPESRSSIAGRFLYEPTPFVQGGARGSRYTLPAMIPMRRAFPREPWHYEVSLWLLIATVLVYLIRDGTSGAFLVVILVTISWFVAYGVVILCGTLARADEAFWKWFGWPT